jgi:hypothetical protein
MLLCMQKCKIDWGMLALELQHQARSTDARSARSCALMTGAVDHAARLAWCKDHVTATPCVYTYTLKIVLYT